MDKPFYEEDYRGCKIQLTCDTDPESPREWDNLGTMRCWHSRYNLGDKPYRASKDPQEFLTSLALLVSKTFCKWDAMREQAEYRYCEHDGVMQRILGRWIHHRDKALEAYVILPLYLYDHSGITMSTSQFSCPWDSGQVGFIYCPLDKAIAWYGLPAGSTWDTPVVAYGESAATLRDRVTETLISEVGLYDSFLTGDVVSFDALDESGEILNSVGGYYPDRGENGFEKRWDDVLAEARDTINCYLDRVAKEAVGEEVGVPV